MIFRRRIWRVLGVESSPWRRRIAFLFLWRFFRLRRIRFVNDDKACQRRLHRSAR
jgi:hypothetical protein